MPKDKNYYLREFKNGLKSVYYFRPQRHTFYLDAVINCGSIHEARANWGISHLLEHVVMSGTKSFKNVKALSNYTNKIGGYTNASTSYNQVHVYGEFPYTEAKNAIRLLFEHIAEPTFSPKIIKSQKGIISDEILSEKESKSYRLTKFVYEKTLQVPDAYFYHFPLGDVETLHSIEKNNLVDWHQTFYHPQNMIVGGTGAIPPNDFFGYVEEKFCKLEKPKNNMDLLLNYYDILKVKQKEQVVVAQNDPIFEKANLIIIFPYVNFLDNTKKEFATGSVIRDYLVNNPGSILFQELREKTGMVYNVHSSTSIGIIEGSWLINTSFDMKHFDKIIKIIRKALDDLIQGKINPKDIKSRKEYIEKTFMMKYDVHSNALYDYMSEHYFHYLTREKTPIHEPEEIKKIFAEISMDDVKKLASKIVDFDKINVIIYGKVDPDKRKQLETKLNSTFIKK